MSDGPSVRPFEPRDTERVVEVAESAMTASYALSPNDIETIHDEEFAGDTLRARSEDSDVDIAVGEVDGVVAGFVETSVDGDQGVVRWLHVDPEHRGRGVGTTLFEHAVGELDDRCDEVRAIVLSSNTSPGAFFERFDFRQVDERTVDIGGRETVQYEYAERTTSESESEAGTTGAAEADDASEADDSSAVESVDLPDAVDENDETVHLGEDLLQGTEGPFLLTYADEAREEKHGYYCANCGGTDVTMDSMERLKCRNCGNTHTPGEKYDGSYL
ncbi:GNAT family N-acetyltransferase [Salinigranum sp. GCM10025319]|uniref:GNAT family N-acetyltransferase n=1 Tax=Salinigranum sp. GCM10025319 TaxID=3252687 RepID=UPI003618DE50